MISPEPSVSDLPAELASLGRNDGSSDNSSSSGTKRLNQIGMSMEEKVEEEDAAGQQQQRKVLRSASGYLTVGIKQQQQQQPQDSSRMGILPALISEDEDSDAKEADRDIELGKTFHIRNG